LRGATIVTCDDERRVVVEGDLLIDGPRILEVGAGPEIDATLAGARGIAHVVDCHGTAVIPGLVQAHVHLCQVLFRGMADDMPLLEWLKTRIWPFEAAHDEESITASAELGLLEMMLAGTTTILDMGTVHEYAAVFDACARSGVRAIGGKTMMDVGDGVPARLRETMRSSLDESEALAREWSGKGEGRLAYAFAPRFILSCTEGLIRGAAERARDLGALMHSHVAEHAGEREAVRAALGDDDIAVLRRWGFHGERAILAHGVQLTDAEARAVAEDRTRIVHCPSANLKLGSGIARVSELDAVGVALALGADGAPCNNNLDPWVELRHAALLAKIRTGVTTLTAERAFRLATIDGARALGLDREIGSLEVGKRADVVVVRIDGPHVEPGGDVYSRLVYACAARDVSDVFVDGERIVRKGEHTTLDRDAVLARARSEAKKVAGRAAVLP
jgi:cytosine/adenosine deaminase-related metal-dependent hydrolase